jgi:hypothetical protein
MGSLRINKVAYEGDKYYFHSPIFSKNLIVIEGDNGTGKTTFCNLIYYGLGGRVKEFAKDAEKRHKEITGDTNNFVELYISLSGRDYQLRRFFNDNDITVTPYTTEIDPETKRTSYSTEKHAVETRILPIFRSSNNQFIFSDWMLEQLGISVVELYQGYTTFKVNFTELFRLIYHDQQPNPEYIYKQLDTKGNFVSDSELLRKAIFELLIGKSFSEYYEAIVATKEAEKERALAKSVLDQFTLISNQLAAKNDIKNKSFLEEELKEKEKQLEKLHQSRNAFKRNRQLDASVEPAIRRIKDEILEGELAASAIKEELVALYDEKTKLLAVKNGTASEIAQINKIIHAHDQLNLFSADTCPYCLSKVERTAGHCVCGSAIDEKQYERFFYTSQEYKDILKSRTKTLATIDLAITDCEIEIDEKRKRIDEISQKLSQFKVKLRANIEKLDEQVDVESLNDIDDMILETREEMSLILRRIENEAKLEQLAAAYEAKRQAHQSAQLHMNALESATKLDITKKVNQFSAIYNRLMTETLSDCRSARINIDNYLPVINEGEYKEASSGVSIRLMYYLTLIEMSLSQDNVPFPKFLLVDTPETAGIELANLINCMEKMEELEDFEINYQIILTTGLNKYPEHFADNRVIFLPNKQNALLKERST